MFCFFWENQRKKKKKKNKQIFFFEKQADIFFSILLVFSNFFFLQFVSGFGREQQYPIPLDPPRIILDDLFFPFPFLFIYPPYGPALRSVPFFFNFFFFTFLKIIL